jgi:hypothetical protein
MRSRLKRLKEGLEQGAVVIQLRNGETRVFSERAALGQFSLQMNEDIAAYGGVPLDEPTSSPKYEEARALRRALEDATPESRAAYEEQCHRFLHLINVLRRSHEEMAS